MDADEPLYVSERMDANMANALAGFNESELDDDFIAARIWLREWYGPIEWEPEFGEVVG